MNRPLLSLRAIVRRELKSWRTHNLEYRRAGGRRIERLVFLASARLGRVWGCWLIAVFLLATASYAGRSLNLWSYDWLPDLPEDTIGRLLGLQATLAALTYPIVLAMVGVLLRGSWSDLRVRVYLAYSGALIAGSSALAMIALSAFYLDITSERHRSRIVGIKESSVALGGVAGPLLVVGASGWTTPQGVFITSGVIILAAAVLALVALKGPRRTSEAAVDVEWECSTNRCMAAHATLRGVVIRASTARGARVAA